MPFGFKPGPGGTIIEDEAEQKALSILTAMWQDWYTCEEISAALTAEGLMNRRGNPYSRQSLHRIIHRQDIKRHPKPIMDRVGFALRPAMLTDLKALARHRKQTVSALLRDIVGQSIDVAAQTGVLS